MTVTINGEKGVLHNGAYTEGVEVLSTAATTYSVDPANGTLQHLTFTSAVTIDFNNFSEGQGVTLVINPSSTVTWPAGMKTYAGSGITLTGSSDNLVSVVKFNSTIFALLGGEVS